MLSQILWSTSLALSLAISTSGEPAQKKDNTLKYSKTVRVNRVDFELGSIPVWIRPGQIYDEHESVIVLRISNQGDQELTFDFGDALRLSLKAPEKPDMILGPIPKRYFPKPLKVAVGKKRNSDITDLPRLHSQQSGVPRTEG